MKILLVNKFHYYRGGSEKYYFELADLLKENGHEVAFFSMQNKQNISTGNIEYFVDEIDLNTASKLKALDVIYSSSNKEAMKKALEEFKPDIVHVNNFQRQLSASIIEAVKEKNIPLILTAHDENSVCPSSILLYNGEICEDCLHKGYFSCIKKSCVKNSTLKSVLGVMEQKYYRKHKVFKSFDVIITPSKFCKNKLIEGGLAYNRIEVLPNFVIEKEDSANSLGENALFIGRLSSEKGVINLIKAIKDTTGTLLIAGDGPEKDVIETYIIENQLEDRIKLLGYLNQEEIRFQLRNCRFVVIPSICYENCPYSILEAMEIGKPIIGSNIGGIPELITENENGFLFESNDIKELSEKMQKLFDNDDSVYEMSKNSRKLFENNYSSKAYYKKLLTIYESVGNKNGKQKA